ncbi:MAG: hypothetical protein HUU20_12255 [Pirellulales bacterium]|nr:hypothetical protein [Pirellulales bacterium]
MPKQRAQIQYAVDHLKTLASAPARVIDAVGPCTLRLERDRYAMLVRSIVTQQIFFFQ